MKEVFTTCTYCGCGCGLYLQVEDGKVLGTMPSERHPVSEGKLCMRGWNVHEIIASPFRLRQPLVRKEGALVPASWEEALDLVVSRLLEAARRYRGQRVAAIGSAKCTNEENFLLMKLARLALGTNNIGYGPYLSQAASLVALSRALGWGAMTNSIAEIPQADVLLVCGSNTTEQHPNIGDKLIQAAEHGATLIVADPRRNQIARFAHLHLQGRPGTDVAWILGLIHVILEEKLYDADFIARHCENFEALQDKVKEFTPGRVEAETGIPASRLVEAACRYSGAKAAMIWYSTGITQYPTATASVLSLANLALITGNIGKPASGLCPLAEHNNSQGACDMGVHPEFLSGYQPVAERAIREKFEARWGGRLTIEDGLGVLDIMQAAASGEIRAIFLMGDDPMVSHPDIGHVREALSKVDFLVVQDIFLTDTAAMADVVLPGETFAAKDGTFTSVERRVQRIRKAIEPLPDARPDIEILAELLTRMGYPTDPFPARVMEEIAALTPIYGGISYERLKSGWGLQWPCYTSDHPGTPFLYGECFPRGKAYLSPVDYHPLNEPANVEYPFTMAVGRSYFYWNTSAMTKASATLKREYSAILLDYPKGFAEINPEDARELGIRDGNSICITSPRGQMQIQAMVTQAVAPKMIFVPFYLREQASQLLTVSTLDTEARMPTLKVCSVKVERVR